MSDYNLEDPFDEEERKRQEEDAAISALAQPADPPAPEDSVDPQAAPVPDEVARAASALASTEDPNLDMTRRPWAQNPDGSISTVRSMGIEDNGQEVLIPTVSDSGQVMSDDDARDAYSRSGAHMGKYKTPEAGTAAAIAFHESQMSAPPANTLDGSPDEIQSQIARASEALKAQNANPNGAGVGNFTDTGMPPAPEPSSADQDIPALRDAPPFNSPVQLDLGQDMTMTAGKPPPEAQSPLAISALAAAGKEEPNPADPAAEAPVAPTERAPVPGQGASSTTKSPEAKELPAAYGTGNPPPANADDAAKTVATVPSNNQAPKAGSAPSNKAPAPPSLDISSKADPLQALMQLGEQQRRQALEQMGERPGVNGWALLADVAFNKGHSIPGIINQADAAGKSWDADKRKLLTHSGSGDPIQQALRMKQLELAEKQEERLLHNAEGKEAGAAAAAEQLDADREAFLSVNGNDMTPEVREKFSHASPAVFRSMQAQWRGDHKNSEPVQDEHARGVRKDTAARVDAASDTNAANVDQDTATKSQVAGGVRHAQDVEDAALLPTKPETPQQVAARERQTARDAESDRKTAETEARGKRVEAATNETRSQTRQQTFMKSVEKAVPVAVEIQKAEDLIAKYEAARKPVPGVGDRGHSHPFVESGRTPQAIRDLAMEWAPSQSTRDAAAEATQVRSVLSNFEQDLIHNRSGAAFTATEEQKNRISAGTRAGAPLQAVKIALQTMHEIVQAKIGGFASVAPDEAERALTGAGMPPERWGAAAWRRKKPAANSAAPATATAEDDPFSQYLE